MDRTLRALNRFGLGARPGERRQIRDPRAWLHDQLRGGGPLIETPPEAAPDAVSEALRAFRAAAAGDQQKRREARRRLIEVAAAESRAALTSRAGSERPFVERLVAFWSNHLCVSVTAKVLVAPLAGSYEREAIRPHVLGRFEDMVLASAKHPAMLIYLDNFQSIGPSSRGAMLSRRGRAPRGLNENYARELLELHTLGVDGGYTQRDVQELSRILTGWTVAGLPGGRFMQDASGTIAFAFRDLLHEPGTKIVLGSRYDAGIAEGERVVRTLCRHPSTARFVAGKLAAHFVADEPPPAAVDRIARTFQQTGGDLRAVASAIVDLDDAWDERTRKFRTPQDWIVAVLRAFGTTDASAAIMPMLRQLRHPLWGPQSPKGFSDTTQDWADPDALLNRAELARTVGRRLRARQIDPSEVLELVDVPANDPLRRLLADTSIPAGERVALALAGPAFQWR